MKSLALIRFLFLIFSLFNLSLANYCNIESCQGRQHTACRFTGNEKSSRCNKILIDGLTDAEKEEILKYHNEIRQKVAAGEETRGDPGPQPAAREIPPLTWDDELANIAQKWANQCTVNHDSCRNVERFWVGQNTAYRGTSEDISIYSITDMIDLWYSEVKLFDSSEVDKFTFSRPATAHYSQMVWADTKIVGCGAVRNYSSGLNRFYLICNYGPAGNVLGEPVYISI
ncbi:hypothetical protein TKK_0009719 [Trichogramma kaykai]